MINKGKRVRKEEIQGIIFANIPLFGFVLFGLIPLVLSVYLSFNTFKGLRLNSATFVGINNFKAILEDELFYKALGNTGYVLLACIVSLILSLKNAQHLSTKVTLTQPVINGKAKWPRMLVQWLMLMVAL